MVWVVFWKHVTSTRNSTDCTNHRRTPTPQWWPNSSDSLPNEQWKKDPWLFRVYRGSQTTQLYGDYVINHSNSLRILIEQPGFHGKYPRDFVSLHLNSLQVWVPPCFSYLLRWAERKGRGLLWAFQDVKQSSHTTCGPRKSSYNWGEITNSY